jgi:hypothetical protein
MVYNIAKLLSAQVSKMLDQNMLDTNDFALNLTSESMKDVV